MSDLARLRIWDDPAIRGALSWYLDVAENRRPAKFRIAATVAMQLDPATSSEDALWVELNRLTPIFVTRWQAIRAGAPLPRAAEGPSLLELCRELAYRMLAHCNFCPWNCQVDRVTSAKFGACKLASGSRVSSHFHHTGEELFYRGTHGSGTIFFHFLQHAVRLLSGWGHQHGQRQRRGDRPAHTGGDGLDAASRGLPQYQLGWRRGRHSPACHRRRHYAVGPRFHAHAGGAQAGTQNEGRPFLLVRRGAGRCHLWGHVQCTDAMEQQLLHDARKHEDPARACRRLAARLQIWAWPLCDDAGKDPMVLGDGDTQHCVGRRLG